MRLAGCYVAILTHFDGRGALDEDALARHASWLVDEGVSGIVVCGTTGESATMSDDEKLRAMNVVFDAVGSRTCVIGGAGNNSTSESTAFVRRVGEEARVHAIMSVVPYYNKPPQAGIIEHFRAISEVSRFPIVAYNVPGRTVVSMTVETMASVSRLPGVVAIKEASADLLADTYLIEQIGDRVAILSGDDATALGFLAIGGAGVVSVVGNVAPRLMSSMCRAALSGDFAEARRLNHAVAHLHRLMFEYPSPAPAKAVSAALGFGLGAPRLPLVAVPEPRRSSLVDEALAYCAVQ